MAEERTATKGFLPTITLNLCITIGDFAGGLRCNDPDCSHLHQQYHSCVNRHGPNCGSLKKEQWIDDLTAQLFPTSYYHIVFTIPHEFNALILGNRKELFTLLK